MSETRGMPLLSGPPTLPPPVLDESCRKCNKDLRGPMSTLFTRERRCNHCGYMYCSSCAPYTALMPRTGSSGGYDAAPVCSSCIEVLNITAAGRTQLKNYTAARLKQYLDAYNIRHNNVLEKSDLIDIIMKAKRPNGCMPKQNEEYFRKFSVPSAQNGRPRGFFERTFGQAQSPPPATVVPRNAPRTASHEFLRPDLAEMNGTTEEQLQQGPRQNQVPPRPSSQPPPQQRRSSPQHHPYGHPPRPRPPQPSRPTASTQQQPPTAPPRPPPSPPPTLDQLLSMPSERISALSVSQLKAALFAAHVRAPPQALEKADLVERVIVVIEDERRRREREAAAHAAEEEAAQEAARRAREAYEQQEREREERKLEAERLLRERKEAAQARQDADVEQAAEVPLPEEGGVQVQGSSIPKASSIPNGAAPPPPPPPAERTGLCVICQDEEACIAVVDCGHMAMCRDCADLIMASSRECPLCRTRIVTEARLLRIFKT